LLNPSSLAGGSDAVDEGPLNTAQAMVKLIAVFGEINPGRRFE
jgi:hypothetical protein